MTQVGHPFRRSDIAGLPLFVLKNVFGADSPDDFVEKNTENFQKPDRSRYRRWKSFVGSFDLCLLNREYLHLRDISSGNLRISSWRKAGSPPS